MAVARGGAKPAVGPAFPPCAVCSGACEFQDVVDFNRSCEELRGLHLPHSGVPITYARCRFCGFCYAPEMYQWTRDQFAERVYNDDYHVVDPDFAEVRPKTQAEFIIPMLGDAAGSTRHLDYGGGQGRLTDLLTGAGFESVCYDPFETPDLDPRSLGQFDLITVFEVFEHVPDVNALMHDLLALRRPGGAILLSTLLSDQDIAPGKPLTWWYAAPRNGHISLFSHASLQLLANRYGFTLGSFDQVLHVMWTDPPPPWIAERIQWN